MNTFAHSSAHTRPRTLNTLLDGPTMPSLHLRLVSKLTRQQTQLAGTVSFARLTAVVAAGIRRSGRPTPQLRVTLATLSVLFLCVFCSTAHAGATISVSAPSAGATVNCAVTVAASMSFTGTDQQKGPPTFYFGVYQVLCGSVSNEGP